ncbi:MAG: cytochrome c3 family protein [Deltaproteobacteria bacterium]|nr:cytochrome c3 family protein [Deltaproteobacteria bacterium]
MKKAAVFIFAIVVVSAFLFVSAYSQEEMTFVDNSVFTKPERTPSVFRHDEHNEKAGIEECNKCHHVYEDGKLLEDESSEDQSCSECHELKSSGNNPALMKAYHTNCKGCHLKEKKGPVMCGECHQKW